ncbi:MAG: HD domain-containing protein [Erysipelotrichaceae bacterium]|nr:HD domain-containing protein [Erysipelotrichaceae bacterium]
MTVGLKRGTVVLEEHQSIWEKSAEEAMGLLREVLKDEICAVEHVGSTAVPSIKAKPIIDLAVAVKDLDDVSDKKEELERRGIYLRSVSDEELLLVMGDLQKDTRSHHIHVVGCASKKWKDYLRFRDHLRKDEEDARRYEKLKEELCEKFGEDRASYTKGKEDFIKEILKKAKEKEMDERIKKQLAFALEIDKEKNIFRQTHLSGHGRAENDAEHAWHMAIMAYLLREYANEEVDIGRVMLMCLIHDIVEIDAGDTYAYDAEGLKTQKEREEKAKERIFSLLPEDQKKELVSLFDEFEDYESAESRFAHAMDNLQPLILNNANEGGDWKDHDVNAATVYGRQKKTALGSKKLFEVTDRILQEHIKKGNLKE